MTAVSGDGLVSLTCAAQSGDRDALADLLAELRPQVFRYVLARLADRASAEDVTQEVAMTVLAALPRYVDTGRPPIAWVFGIAQKKIAESHRAARRRRESVTEMVPDSACPDAAGNPEAHAERLETTRRLAHLLDALPAQQAEILRLRVGAGLSAEQTATVVGSTPGAVRVAQHRALAALRIMLAADGARA